MNNLIISQFFQEYLNGIWKGSMNRLLALLIVSACIFVAIWCVIHNQNIPDATLIEFLSFVAVLLGLSWNAKKTDIQSTTPNPNLPKPNDTKGDAGQPN